MKLVQGTPRCIQQIPLTDDKSSQKGASKEEQESNAKDGEYTVQWASEQQQQQGEEQFDLVLAAVGRAADTTGLNLQAAGVKTTGIGAKAAAPDGSSSSGGGGGDVVLVGPPGTAATANSKVYGRGPNEITNGQFEEFIIKSFVICCHVHATLFLPLCGRRFP